MAGLFQKPTSFLVFGGLELEGLAKRCSGMSCGNKVHVRLGFGASSTAAAAEYPPGLAAAYAGAVANHLWKSDQEATAIERLSISTSGVLVRHMDRGATDRSARQLKAAEDDASRAGARNPFQVLEKWPAYVEALDPVRKLLTKAVRSDKEFQGLAGACGKNPTRPPPSAKAVRRLRLKLGKLLGLSKEQTQAHHPASPWRYNLVRATQERAQDPDIEVHRWLKEGAPFGIAEEIRPGGLLPLIREQPILTADQLSELDACVKNHGSFNEQVDGQTPALAELSRLVDCGFARVCKDEDQATDWLGQKPVISPLGNVVKIRPDASRKNRLIQDFRASSVNAASVVQERQVLPRFADHGRDLAALSALGSSVGVFVLDFKHAFMTIPLACKEMPFNTSVVPEKISRTREALDEDEPKDGRVLIWRVWGFGGHANPLVYSRVATFAARSAQTLLQHPKEKTGIAHGRIQLYVDDLAVVLQGGRSGAK